MSEHGADGSAGKDGIKKVSSHLGAVVDSELVRKVYSDVLSGTLGELGGLSEDFGIS